MNKKTLSIILFIIVYVVSAGLSYTLFAGSKTKIPVAPPKLDANGVAVFDNAAPKTEACPINGEMFSKQQRQWWEQHRPLGVMIENHPDARPQSGLSSADAVYEAVAEGGITRFLAVFYCQDTGAVGPVRSARTYFLDFISEYGDFPLYAHVGGANCNDATGSGCGSGAKADALGQIKEYGWFLKNDLSEFSLSYPTFQRIERPNGRDVATEHTVFSSTQKLWDVGKKRNLTNVDKDGNSWDKSFVPYKFKEEALLADRTIATPPASQTVHIEFWKDYGEFAVDWTYDKVSNTYLRKVGGELHLDRNTKKQLSTKNIIVLVMQESNANDGYDNNVHLLYKTIGSGKAYVFQDGKEIKATWTKESRTDRTIIKASDGSEVQFVKGQLWFEIVPTNGVVDVK